MAKAFTILANGKKMLLDLEGPDIPGISSNQVISDELAPGRLPTKGIEYEKLSPPLMERLVEMAELEIELARGLIGETATSEVRGSEHYGASNIEIR